MCAARPITTDLKGKTLLHHPTLDRLQQLRLTGMARALAAQSQQADIGQLGFEERLGLLLDSEAAERESRQNATRLKRAKLKQAATPEDVDFRHPRGLDRALFARLMAGDWVAAHQNVLICGPNQSSFTVNNERNRFGHRRPARPPTDYRGGNYEKSFCFDSRHSRYSLCRG